MATIQSTRDTDPIILPHTDQPTHVLDAADQPLALKGREWLVSNGAGGYAMGTAAGINTRRYHGLLVAATHPPVARIVALNGVLEQWIPADTDEDVIEFNANAFHTDLSPNAADAIVPDGHRLLKRFERGLSVAWLYQHQHIHFQRNLLLHWKQQAATLRYTIHGAKPGDRLRLSPMLTLRDFHALLFKDQADSFNIQEHGDWLLASRAGNTVSLHCPNARFIREESWWYGFHYEIESRRGQNDREDQFIPGAFEVELDGCESQTFTLTVTLGDQPASPIADSRDRQKNIRKIEQKLNGVVAALRDTPQQAGQTQTGKTSRGANFADTFLSQLQDPSAAQRLARSLAIASDDFVVDRVVSGQRLATIVAGYPWFADWGRDTFIALDGLLLATGRFNEAKQVLRAFAASLRNGLVPNRFDDYDDNPQAAHYNTVDASLWFIHAAIRYFQVTRDHTAWNDFLSHACLEIINAYIHGTTTIGHTENAEIRMAGDGLVTAGSPHTQLTWMDAACPDPYNGQLRVFTPRYGKAIEINALWFNALAGMAQVLAETDSHTAEHYTKLTKRIKRSFGKVFWNDQADCLFDHVWYDDNGDAHPDPTLRPNQILAVSLPHSPLPRNKQKKIIDLVRDKLLTPFGLKTLPQEDPHFHAHYHGPRFQRDQAYHQGTVWPWLIGPFCEAVLRQSRFSPKAVKDVRRYITPLVYELLGQTESHTASIGQLHEIHEAAPPHAPVGCMAQAWSVAELLRVLCLLSRDQ